MNKAVPGQKHISARDWNEFRDFMNSFCQQGGGMVNNPWNPFFIMVKNATSSNLDAFSVVRIDTAMYPNASNDELKAAALNLPVELDGEAPKGEKNECIAILQQDLLQGEIGKAVVCGASLCYVQVLTLTSEFEYAASLENDCTKLNADRTGQAKIIWRQPGTGNKLAFVLLNQDRYVMHCLNEFRSNDQYPDGATQGFGFVYCDDLDSVDVDTNYNPRVYNPLGLPEYHRTIIAKVEGFPGEAESSDSPGGRKVGDYVAISSDPRDYVVLTTSNLSAIDAIKNDSNWILQAGDCIYVDAYYNDPNGRRYWGWHGPSLDGYGYNIRLVVCQRSIPKGYDKDFIMPFYPIESGLGFPAKADPLQFNSVFNQMRCGINPTNPDSVTMTDQVWDYVYDGGRYIYQPRFEFYAAAVDPSTVTVESSGNAIIGKPNGFNSEFNSGFVAFKFLDGKYYTAPGYRMSTGLDTWFGADIWPGDTIKVHCHTHGYYGPDFAIIDYPIDYRDGMVIANYSGNIGSQRGWVPATMDDTYNQDLPANPTGNYILGLYGSFGYSSLANYIAGQSPAHTELNGFTVYNAYNIKWYKKTKTQGNTNALV